jgi:hypothetical protein
MKISLMLSIGLLLTPCSALFAVERQQSNMQTVEKTDGLIAFWDFDHAKDSTWMSYYDPKVLNHSFSLHLKRIGDPQTYSTNSWPYEDANSKLMFDDSGPFGKAVRFNKGYIYGAVERRDFDGTPLDLHGKRPFTMIAWMKFIGSRHMVAGIWDEGGWNKYAGRRQAALFAGLFGQKGVISHVSATGAASYPQSTIGGAQYARCRAIDGKPFKDNQWVAMATTYDPERGIVIAYLNGTMTPLHVTDPVAQDIYQYKDKQSANPFGFSLPIYSPRAFVLKYNGYSLKKTGISEHRLHVDLVARKLTYMQDKPTAKTAQAFRLFFDVKRQGKSILANPIEVKGVHTRRAAIPADTRVMTSDEVWTRLETQQNGKWKQVGTVVKRKVLEGAPFTFGRALGLGSGTLGHGSQLYLDGVAIFNRILKEEELKKLSFNTNIND